MYGWWCSSVAALLICADDRLLTLRIARGMQLLAAAAAGNADLLKQA